MELTVPCNCPFAVLHPLETRTGGTQTRRRQSGKTTELVELSNEMAMAGYTVYYLTCTEDMAQTIRARFGTSKNVKVMSWRQSLTHLRGMSPGVIIADELTKDEMERVDREILSVANHLFLAHYWTPR